MQYGHWVTWATATAINCLVFVESAPGANTLRLNSRKALACSGARRVRSSAISGVACGKSGSVAVSVGIAVSCLEDAGVDVVPVSGVIGFRFPAGVGRRTKMFVGEC
jgi:hypothetical protein